MNHGDHVKIIGRDGFYVFLKEDEGMAILEAGSAILSGNPVLAIPISKVVSLEKT
jgi:hypothetical protein